MTKISNTRNLFRELLKASLQVNGYKVTSQKEYFLATKEDEKYLILSVTRTLPNTETTTVEASKKRVTDLEKKCSRMKGKPIPCLAYGVGVYENTKLVSMETLLVRLDTISKYAPTEQQTGRMFSRASGHCHYNYEKYETDNGKPYELFREVWHLK